MRLPAVIPDFKKKLGKDLGIMPIPRASDEAAGEPL